MSFQIQCFCFISHKLHVPFTDFKRWCCLLCVVLVRQEKKMLGLEVAVLFLLFGALTHSQSTDCLSKCRKTESLLLHSHSIMSCLYLCTDVVIWLHINCCFPWRFHTCILLHACVFCREEWMPHRRVLHHRHIWDHCLAGASSWIAGGEHQGSLIICNFRN